MGLELSTKQIAVILAAVAVVSVSAAFFYVYEVRYVPTDSMDGEPQDYEIPTIPKGSAILVQKYSSQSDIDSLKVGDVILFYNTSNHLDTVHRIIDITEVDANGHIVKVTTHGDNKSPGTNETVNSSDIHGKVVGVSKELGGFVHFVQSSTILLVMIIVILIVMVSVVWDIIKIRRNEGQ